MKKLHKVVLLATTALAAPMVQAQEIIELDAITVYGTRTATDAVRETYTIETIDTSDAGSDIVKAVEDAAGLNVVRSGPRGQITSVFTRGTDSDQTGLSLNGVSIIDAATPNSQIDLGIHSMVGVSSIEVMRGPQSVMYGSSAIGGNINLNTAPTVGNSISQTLGSNGLSVTNLTVGQQVGDSTIVNLEIESEKRDGPSAAAEGTEDDPFESKSFALSQETDLANGWSIYAGIIDTKSDISYDESGADADYTGDLHFRNIQAALSNDNTRIVVNRATHDRDYNEPYAATAWGPAGVRNAEYNSQVDTLQAEHTFNFSPSLDLTVGGEAKNTTADFKSAWGDVLDATRQERGVYGTLSYSLGDVVVVGSARIDDSNDFGNHTSTRLAAGYKGFRASVSTGYRLPSLYEMHGQGAWVVGNPNLEAETSKSVELGYGNEWLDLAVYKIDTKNSINADYTAGTYANDNGSEESYGAELTTKHSVGQFDISQTLTYNHTVDADGEQRLRRPNWAHALNVGTEVVGFYVVGSMNYYGKSKDYSWPNTLDVDPVRTFDLSASRDYGDLSVKAAVLNVTDQQYERPHGYSQDGRTFMLTGTLKF